MIPPINDLRVEFDYDPQQKKMFEVKNTIGNAHPSSTTIQECVTGWIRAVNRVAPAIHARDFGIDLQVAEKSGYQGKWIVKFRKNDPQIDQIWERVKKGVEEAVFTEAKVSIPHENFQEQVILVYTMDYHSERDVAYCLQEMIKRGIISQKDDIPYKTESATRQGDEKYTYTSLTMKLPNASARTPLDKISFIARQALSSIGSFFKTMGSKIASVFKRIFFVK